MGRPQIWQSESVVDALFANSRLASLYDPLDPDRSDLDAYAAMVEEFGASRVVDLGCGTGTLACLLGQRGVSVIGVDPAAASLAVARRKPHAEKVRWVHGDASATAGRAADLVTMTGNVAQVFVADDDWHTTLRAVRTAPKAGWCSRPGTRFDGHGRVGPARRRGSGCTFPRSARSRPGPT